jgi:hypothetical protein
LGCPARSGSPRNGWFPRSLAFRRVPPRRRTARPPSRPPLSDVTQHQRGPARRCVTPRHRHTWPR